MSSEDRKVNVNLDQGNYFENVEGNVILQTAERFDQITGIPNNLPLFKSNYFVGRDKDLEKLHQLLQQTKTVAISAISGMGGIGKTELAIQYALKYLEEYPGSICWLRAREDIGTQIINFAVSSFKLSIPENLDIESQVQYCWNIGQKIIL